MLPRAFRPALFAAVFAVSGLQTPGVHAATTFDVAMENALPGIATWKITEHQFDGRVRAFTDRTSVLPGESFGLYVTCRAAEYRVTALRMGYYDGAYARSIWSSDTTPCESQTGRRFDDATNTASAKWQRSMEIDTTDWPEGMYLLRITADGTSRTFVNLVVRSESTADRVVFTSAFLTFQAYNDWGGASAYRGKRGFSDRARVVSFDRPQQWGLGAGKFLAYELPLLARAEALGLPLAYVTDIDIATIPHLLAGASAVITGGHSEYWTQSERDAVLKARARGTNLLFFGANTAYWRVRLSPSRLGPNRTMAIYKSRAKDPDTEQPSIRFRDAGLPESQLTGLMYACFPAKGPFTVKNAASWVYDGTGARNGDSFDGITGPEIDKLTGDDAGVTVLASSRSTCAGRPVHSMFILKQHDSGAFTANVGTMGWVSKALRGAAPARSVAFVQQVTDNLLIASQSRAAA